MKISKQLYNFFKAYKEWVSNGAEVGKIFERTTGLCYNLVLYRANKDLPFTINDELKELLEDRFGNSEYPFGEHSYGEREYACTQHLCPERMSFVDKCIEAYESTGKEEKVVKSKSKYSLKIGDKVKGVKFSNADYPHPGWGDEMEECVGKVGKVIDVGYLVRVDFGNADWWYPAHILKKVEDNVTNEQPVKKEGTPKSTTNKSATPKSVWGVVDMETGNVISIEITREKARQMKARLNGDFKIAKMAFDKWVS